MEGKGRTVRGRPRLALVWGPRMVNPALGISAITFVFVLRQI